MWLEPLQGELVTLRPVAPGDVEAMWEMLSDPEGRRQTGDLRERSREDVERWCAEVAGRTDRVDLAITHGSDEYLGEIVLEDIDREHRRARMRLALRPGQRGRGFGGEAIELVLAYGFAPLPAGLGLHRVALEVLSVNPRARMLYESLGFLVEGRQRESHRDGEFWCDSLLMGILEDDYRATHVATG
ncbi:GNAT family N-acetyltransferase [Cellulomonas bogoriensis]|uniref:GCN5 family acetyltransferase n=1 Tax=Cellulomonas bogoriensis 69B4 = DSM 16987 TaxID=1386082 RepID=A0A0A0C190_9CELL|nr:GNAT family protein [Cellulomonas bogoriensis]KGM14408.1 GCN5 family acetyltransferase [Cellulomonas bogoriensis 69B4 = DSM 16987]